MREKTLLFCIPYAGGSASSLAGITNLLDQNELEIHFMELPARGRRLKEPFPKSLDIVIEDISNKIIEILTNKNQRFIIWGHSMGAILALFISYKLKNENYSLIGLIVSGMKAPTSPIKSTEKSMSREQRNQLLLSMLPIKHERNRYNSTFLKIQERRTQIMDMDIQLVEKFAFNNWDEISIEAPIAIIVANKDEIYPDKDCYQQWKLHTKIDADFYAIDGGHFFMFQDPVKTSKLLNKVLTNLLT